MNDQALEFERVKRVETFYKGIDGEHPTQSNHGSAAITAFILTQGGK